MTNNLIDLAREKGKNLYNYVIGKDIEEELNKIKGEYSSFAKITSGITLYSGRIMPWISAAFTLGCLIQREYGWAGAFAAQTAIFIGAERRKSKKLRFTLENKVAN